LLPLTVKNTEYRFNNEALPAISASASKDSTGTIHISLVNIDAANARNITIEFKSGTYHSVTGRILKSARLQDHNTFNEPEKIKPEEYNKAILNGRQLQCNLPPFSVVVLEVK
jgi:alpha-N-arabinofuranosidase